MRRLTAITLSLALFAGSAAARPYTVDDLLITEDLGAAGFDPTGRWLVVERRGPYRTAPYFDGNELAHRLAGDLLVVDVRARAPQVRRILRPEASGLLAGPFAPGGQSVAIVKASEQSADVGILDLASGAMRWLGVTPEMTLHGQSVVWRSDSELLVIQRDAATPPPALTGAAVAEARAQQLRLQAQAGGRSATVNASGRFSDAAAERAQTLVSIDLASGRPTVIMRGVFDDMELSPSRRYLALLAQRGDRPPRPEEPFRGAAALVHRELWLIDLATGSVTHPTGDRDLSVLMLRWSPTRDELLVLDPQGGTEGEAAVLRVDADSATAQPVLGDAALIAEPMAGAFLDTLGAIWLDAGPAVYASPKAGGRKDWYLLGEAGPVNLTASLPAVPGRPVAALGDGLIFPAAGGLQRLGPDGVSLLSASPPFPRLGDAARRWSQPSQAAPADLPPSVAGLSEEPVTGIESAMVTVRRDGRGDTLVLSRPSRGRVALARLNAHLAEVDLVAATPLVHQTLGGQVTSWLYRPPSRGPAPLIVLPYPGASYTVPPAFGGGHRMSPLNNVQILTGAGYAVLVPGMPPLPGPIDPDAITTQIDDAVDAALARGGLDRKRIALWGHSFGGYATLAAATRSHRYRAYVASAAPSDLGGVWGRLSIVQSATPAPGLSLVGAGWAENGQARLSAPPWAVSGEYIAASPFYAADRVTAPVLLLHGEADDVPLGQANAMFSALQRQGKDAQLVTYFGEGHVFGSPGNLRDLYERVLQFLDVTMPPPGASRRAAAPSTRAIPEPKVQ